VEHQSSERNGQRESRTKEAVSFGFLSVKGGCGATTLACHVAAELASPEQKVLLMDLDLHGGLVGFITKAKVRYSISDALENLHRLDSDYWKWLVSKPASGFEILASPPLTLVPCQEVKAEEVRQLLGFVRPHYDWLVVDLGNGLSQLTVAALGELDQTCLVTTLEVPALFQCLEMIRALLGGGYEKHRIKLILNRAPKRLDITLSELERMLGAPIFFMLPNDYPELYETYANGHMLTHDSELGRAIGTLALTLAGLGKLKA
jgi:pilus assembly protein CpaE